MDRILVIGGGAAGLTAARTISAAGGKAVILTGAIGGGSSPWAQGGIAAAIGSDDSPALHFADTVACGGGITDEPATWALVDEAAEAIDDLIAIGTPFDRQHGEIVLGLEGGHSRRRIVHAGGGATGWHVIEALAAAVKTDPNITIIEGVTVTGLVVIAGRVAGLYCQHADRPIIEQLDGPVVLATGGAAGLFGRSTNPATVNGAGIALAWEAGAALADMEFVQFHPTALDLPAPHLGGRALLLTEALRGEGAHLLDSQGHRFMLEGPLAHPLAELAPRDEVARAIHAKRREGPVHFSLRHVDPDTIRRHFPNLVSLLAPLGLDLATDLLPVAPAAHYLMGGVLSDIHGASTVPGLYVAGEVACTGVQGANRLASNSILECLVFGRRAGLAALDRRAPTLTLDAAAPIESAVPLGSTLPDDLGAALDRYLGVERDAEGIGTLLGMLPESGPGKVARRMAVAAAIREEWRGAHFRTDHPAADPAWQGRIVQRKNGAPVFLPVAAPVPA